MYFFFIANILDHVSITTPSNSRPTSKFMQAVDVLRRFMEKYDGSVYMKAPEASLKHIFCCSVRKFVLNILANAEIADQIATFVNPLCNLSEKPSSHLLKPIDIDFNYIDVLPIDMCFNIAKKTFEMEPKALLGSPRAFIKYTYRPNYVPEPMPFIEGILNF